MASLFLIAVGYVLGVLFPSTWLRSQLTNAWEKVSGFFKNSPR